jgi:Ankyrin repeats (3 copies)
MDSFLSDLAHVKGINPNLIIKEDYLQFLGRAINKGGVAAAGGDVLVQSDQGVVYKLGTSAVRKDAYTAPIQVESVLTLQSIESSIALLPKKVTLKEPEGSCFLTEDVSKLTLCARAASIEPQEWKKFEDVKQLEIYCSNLLVRDQEPEILVLIGFGSVTLVDPLTKPAINREALFQNEAHISSILLGFSTQFKCKISEDGFLVISEGGEEVKEQFGEVIKLYQVLNWLVNDFIPERKKQPCYWRPLMIKAIEKESVEKEFFSGPRAVPVCKNGHTNETIKFKEVNWNISVPCSMCEISTNHVIETCRRRCQFTALCEDCEKITKKKLDLEAELETKIEQELQQSVKKDSFELEASECAMFYVNLEISPDNEVEKLRFDPCKFQELLLLDLMNSLRILRPQVIFLDKRVRVDGVLFALVTPDIVCEMEIDPNRSMTRLPRLIGKLQSMIRMKNFRDDSVVLKRVVSVTLLAAATVVTLDQRKGLGRKLLEPYIPGNPRIGQCPLECGAELVDKDFSLHIREICPCRIVECPFFCGISMIASEIQDHISKDCTQRLINCPSDCGEIVKAISIDDHIRRRCGMRLVVCECGISLKYNLLSNHSESDCILRPTECLWCHEKLPANQIDLHKKTDCPLKEDMERQFYDAAWSSDTERCQSLVNDGLDLLGPGTQLVLHAACATENIKLTEYLISCKVSLNQQDPVSGYTPLHVCVAKGHKSILELLLSHNSDIHVTDHENRTPLLLAVFLDRLDLVKVLMAHGANENEAIQQRGNRLLTRNWDFIRSVIEYDQENSHHE